jgi:hypothetical protein
MFTSTADNLSFVTGVKQLQRCIQNLVGSHLVWNVRVSLPTPLLLSARAGGTSNDQNVQG